MFPFDRLILTIVIRPSTDTHLPVALILLDLLFHQSTEWTKRTHHICSTLPANISGQSSSDWFVKLRDHTQVRIYFRFFIAELLDRSTRWYYGLVLFWDNISSTIFIARCLFKFQTGEHALTVPIVDTGQLDDRSFADKRLQTVH